MQHDFILLDRSGSMAGQWLEAINSVNSYVQNLAQEGVDTGVTLAAFDSDGGRISFDILRERIRPQAWQAVQPNEAPPRGMTPLNDSTARLVNLALNGGYDRCAIIIMTDGLENSSHEYSVQQVKALLDQCRAKDWQVIFLGANFDNAAQAATYGATPAYTAQSSTANLGATMRHLSETRVAYAASGKPMTFTPEQKEQLKGERAVSQSLNRSDQPYQRIGQSEQQFGTQQRWGGQQSQSSDQQPLPNQSGQRRN